MALGAASARWRPTFEVLMVARVVQGVGAAAIPVLATALITARFSGDDRAVALGRIAGVAATLGSLGPLLGGAAGGAGRAGGWPWRCRCSRRWPSRRCSRPRRAAEPGSRWTGSGRRWSR